MATGSQLWGDTAKYPWLIGSIPSYATESAVFADYLKANKPDAKVAILAQNDDFGDGYVVAFKKAIEGTNITIVDEQKYNTTDPDVKSQVTTMSQSGADTALLAATALKCPQALNAVKESGWTPTTYISGTCTSSTIVGLAKDANNGRAELDLPQGPRPTPSGTPTRPCSSSRRSGKQYGLSAEDLKNGIVGYGWTMGALLVDTLKQAPELTRQAVMQAGVQPAERDARACCCRASASTPTGSKDPYVIEQMQIGQYNGSYWDLQGPVISFEGKTGDYASATG